MKWIGLTGGVATGKSTAAALLKGLGLPVIDADQIAHKLSETGESGYEKILSHFGKNILNKDRSINRKQLGQIIFSDPQLKLDLENILHPLIKQETQLQKKQYEQKGSQICLYDVPLLFEKNLATDFDHTILIWCDRETQLERMIKHRDLTKEEASLRIQNQLPMVDKVKMATYCVDNSGDMEDLEKQIQKLVKSLT